MKFKLIIICLCFAAGKASPQLPRLSLEECLASALENNLGLKSMQKEIDISRARAGSYLDLPNTSIELSQSSIEGAGMDNGLTFSQEFDFPTVYIARRKVLKAEEQLERVKYSRFASELRGNVYSIYFSLLFQKAKLRILRNDYPSYSEFARISHIRFEDGESSRLEFLNAQRMKIKMEARIEDTQAAIASLQSELAKAIGMERPVDIAGNELFIIDFEDDPMVFDAVSTFSSKIINARIAVNEKAERLARQEFLPGLSVSATTQLLIKGFNPYHVERERFSKGDFMGFGVGITVPLFFGSKHSRLIAAKRETELARLQLEEDLQVQSLEYDNLKNELTLSKKRLGYYTDEALAHAGELRKLASVSYELGEIDYLEYMQNLESAIEIWMEYIETVDRVNQSLIKIQTLKGQI